MSSTPSPLDSLHTVRRDRHQRVLRTHLIFHELMLVMAAITLMLLVTHTAAMHGMQPSGLPQKWLHDFVDELYEGTKKFTWIVMYILIPHDILHALLCIGLYSNQLYPNVRYKDEERRQKRRVRLNNFLRNIAGCLQKRFRRNRSDGQASAPETKRSTHYTTRQTAAESEPSKRTKKTKSHLASDYPPTCHPLLHPDFSTLERLALLTLWDVIMILTLSSHIYIFLENIEPSLEKCRNPILADTLSPRSISLLLNSKDKCHRLNWRIHSAGGYSAGGVAILGALHLFTLIFRFYEHVQAKRLLKSPKTESDQIKRSRKGKEPSRLEEQHWRNPPRDIDVRSRNLLHRDGFSSSLSRSIQVYSLPSMTVMPTTRHLATISQEELNASVLQRDSVRTRRSQQQESDDADHQSEHSRWEALLDTLIP